MNIAGVFFARTSGDTWTSRDGRLILTLFMDTPAYPWQLTIDGKPRILRFSTPHVAITRALHHALAITR